MIKPTLNYLLGSLLSATLILFSSPLLSQSLIIKADRLIDVEKGLSVENPLVLIEDGVIKRVAKQGNFDIPEGYEVLDLSGHTLLPGLIDMHVHLSSEATNHGYKRLAISQSRSTIYGVKNAYLTLMAGFTTVRDVGADGYIDVALRDAINAGDVPGPRLYVSGPPLGVTGGHCDNNLLPFEYAVKSEGIADGPWAVRAKVRQNIKYGADVIKFCATGGVLSKGTKVGVQQYSQIEMNALVEEAKLRGLTVAAHAHGTNGIKAAINAGVTSVEHASFIDKEGIKLAKENGTYLSMDIYVTEYILSEGKKVGILQESLDKERTVGGKQRENFKKAVDAGVKMIFGSDAGVYPHGDNARQFSRMVKFGMTPMQAIQASTLNAATALGKQDIIGSITIGKLADIIAVKGDPIKDISILENVAVVLKEGIIIKQ